MQLLQVSLALQVDPSFRILALVMGWTVTILVAAFAAVIIYKVVQGDKPGGIDLKYLLSGDDGYASLSRFQFLIFTFVIALSLFLIIVNHSPQPGFPDVPGSILALLGISGGSYVVSKGVDANTPPAETTRTVIPPPGSPEPATQTTEVKPAAKA